MPFVDTAKKLQSVLKSPTFRGDPLVVSLLDTLIAELIAEKKKTVSEIDRLLELIPHEPIPTGEGNGHQ